LVVGDENSRHFVNPESPVPLTHSESLRRYVILRHEGIPDPHFDVMVEATPGSPLLTWRTPEWPIGRETNLTKLDEHRRMYLDYEGGVSRGRGFVTRVAHGTCDVQWATNAQGLITFITPNPPRGLQLKHLDGAHWIATPA
jgi:hypothetical protein